MLFEILSTSIQSVDVIHVPSDALKGLVIDLMIASKVLPGTLADRKSGL